MDEERKRKCKGEKVDPFKEPNRQFFIILLYRSYNVCNSELHALGHVRA